MLFLNIIKINTANYDFTRIGNFFFGDHFEKCRLACTRFSDEKNKFVGCNMHGNIIKGRPAVAVIMFGDMVEQYHTDILT